MTNPRLIIADLDGTALGRDEKVSPGTGAVLDRLPTIGIGFTGATGRAAGKLRITGITPWARLPVICATGALTVQIHHDRIERLSEMVLTTEVVTAAITTARTRCPDLAVGVDRHELLITGPGYPPSPDWVTRRDLEPGEDFAAAPVDVLRIWADDAPRLAEVNVPGLAWHDINRPGYIEATAAAASKSAAAAQLAADLGIDPAAVWAIGDGINDLDLLAWAGRGIAMRGSAPQVLAAADDVTDRGHADDGLAHYLTTRLNWLNPRYYAAAACLASMNFASRVGDTSATTIR